MENYIKCKQHRVQVHEDQPHVYSPPPTDIAVAAMRPFSSEKF